MRTQILPTLKEDTLTTWLEHLNTGTLSVNNSTELFRYLIINQGFSNLSTTIQNQILIHLLNR